MTSFPSYNPPDNSAVPASLVINVAHKVTLVADGVTDNAAAFLTFGPLCKVIGQTAPQTVTISIASPAVIGLVSHNLRVNEAVVFSTTGSLPTGIVVGTTYYVISAGLTADTFSVSTKNPFPDYSGEGSAINTSGSQSGTHTLRVQGLDWQNILIPPGQYHVSVNTGITGNQRRARILAYGVVTDNLSFGTFNMATDYSFIRTNFALIQSANSGATSITLVDNTQASRFVVGGWVCLAALDLQNQSGFLISTPPNNHYNEFLKVAAINAGTGVITLQTKLHNSYKSTYPIYYPGTAGSGNLNDISGGGAATIYPMNSDWDMEIEVHGLRSTNTGFAIPASARSVRVVDCVFDADGAIPSVNRSFVAENCRWGDKLLNNGKIEIDKFVQYARFYECIADIVETQSTSIDALVLEGSDFEVVEGTARNTLIRNCDIGTMEVGPLSFGASEKLVVENCRIGRILESPRPDDALASSAFNNCVSNFTLANGVLKSPKATTKSNWWAVPGRVMYVNDMAGKFRSMGSPFRILDVYESPAGTVCMDTTLTALPVGSSTTAAVTVTIASPAVVGWTTHGLVAGTPVTFQTTGALPTGLAVNTLYYVIAAGLTANAFEVSTSVGGVAVNTSGTQSGTHTGISNPLHFQPHACTHVTFAGCTGCADVVDLSNAPDGQPLFSYSLRQYIGDIDIDAQFWNKPTIQGNLSKLRINVVRAYTGINATQTAIITANAFDGNLLPSNLSQTVNLKIAGERIVTPTAVTGAQAGDTLATTSVWISDSFTVVFNVGANDTLDKLPIFDVEIITDQGMAKPSTLVYAGPTQAHPLLIADTTTPAA